MSLESTITEQDMDATSQQFVRSFRHDGEEYEPDLAVDGLTESLMSRIVGLLTFGRS